MLPESSVGILVEVFLFEQFRNELLGHKFGHGVAAVPIEHAEDSVDAIHVPVSTVYVQIRYMRILHMISPPLHRTNSNFKIFIFLIFT